MLIGEIAKMAGVSVRTLRHYHAIGLMDEPARAANGYRDYQPSDLLRLLRIRQLASLGFPLERVGAMLDELDAQAGADAAPPIAGSSSAPPATGSPTAPSAADEQLAALDAALAAQIASLEEQRALIARLRRSRVSADTPARASSLLDALAVFMGEFDGATSLDAFLSDNERLALGIALHVYSDDDLAETERLLRAIPARGLMGACRRASASVEALDAASTREEVAAAATACRALVDELLDCFSPANWLREDHDADALLDALAVRDCNEVQRAVLKEVWRYIARRMEERVGRDGHSGA